MTPDDTTLLREFAVRGSEAAFDELVRRHLAMVYSAALRQLNGNSGLAADVCQSVFVDLARKAHRLGRKAPLAAWLHRCTRLAVLATLRADRRRLAREHEAFLMRQLQPSEPATDWDSVRLLIDEALDGLNVTDRQAVLLRYFRQQTFHQVGVALGVTENAARMRIDRALERLRRLLARRGLATTGAALTAALSAHAVEPLPGGLAAKLVHASLTGSATTVVSTSKLGVTLLMTTKSYVIVGLTAAVLLAVGIQSRRATSGRSSMTGRDAGPSDPVVPGRAARDAIRSRRVTASQGPSSESAPVANGIAAIRAVLSAPGQVVNFPQPTMKEAILSLRERYPDAIPILREALQHPNREVRRRAVGGLCYLSVAASEVVPDLIAMLHQTSDNGDVMLIGSALASIGVTPASIPALVDALRLNESARQVIEPFYPFLLNPDSTQAQEAAAGGQLASATAGLTAGDEDDRVAALTRLYNLGPLAIEAIPQLHEFLAQPNREDQKVFAEKLLSEIDPAFREERENPAYQQSQVDRASELAERIQGGRATVRELIAALRETPAAIPQAAGALGAIGYEEMSRRARENPEAMTELTDATIMLLQIANGAQPLEARLAASEAYTRLQPTRERPIYTIDEVAPAFEVVRVAASRLPPETRDQVQSSLDILIDQQRNRWDSLRRSGDITDYPSSGLRTLARRLADVDPATANTFISAVRKADPNFLRPM